MFAHATSALTDVSQKPLPAILDDARLKQHPLAVWNERVLGLEEELGRRRKKPVSFADAVRRLAEDSEVAEKQCGSQLENFLTLISLPEDHRVERGAFVAFKLHRFISGAGKILTTLTSQPRTVLFEGQPRT